jgi:thiol-disulfide isomerase/thioredoxin
MYRLKIFWRVRGVRLALELTLVVLVYFAVKTYMQRNLVEGPAPPLQGSLLNGQSVSLQSFRGQPVLVHFWATWCPVCKLEQNSIDAISKDHAVLTIAMNSGDETAVESYLYDNHLTFPVIVDQYSNIAKQFGVQGVPTSFVIDSQGNITFTEMGYTTGWGLRLRLWLALD